MTIEKHIWRSVVSSTTSNTKPHSRWGHSSCVIGQQIVIFGGYAESIYMNDIWVYNTQHLYWKQIKTFGAVPSTRSNSSFHFDEKNNRIILFGGGGANKTRYNTIHVLDWNTKFWSQIKLKQNQPCPWQRTYHSSEILYPYLIVYGGQGVADLDDLWIYNLQNNKWTEVPIDKNSTRPCGRRFHSSCLIGNKFYVIAGCYSKYRPLSDLFFIDLSNLIQTGSVQNLKWKQVQFKGNSFLTRWGHACASLQNKIYIFGGRFSNDLNDILVLDIQSMKMKTLKTPIETIPKPRRRACINFIGNCLIMFGGFNSQYFNDLHFINVTEGLEKPKKYSRKIHQLIKMINHKQTADIQIQTINGQILYCHKGLIMHNITSIAMMQNFINKINGIQTKQNLIQLVQILYKGYGKHPALSLYFQNRVPSCQQQKQQNFYQNFNKPQQSSFNNCLLKLSSNDNFQNKHILRNTNNNIIQLNDQNFGQFLQKNRQQNFKDIQIVINDQYILQGNRIVLACGSKYFNYLFLSKFRYGQQDKIIKIYVPNCNIVLIESILNFIMLGMLVVPQNMSCQSWRQLYQLSDYFCLQQLCQIVSYRLSTKIQQSTIDNLLSFSTQNKIQKLALTCARQKMKKLQILPQKIMNKYLKQVYMENRFEIKQKIIAKCDNTIQKKFSNKSTDLAKENYQMYNQ